MSSFLCFICHSTVNAETSEETREKYREVVGINLCPDSQLCFICCHVLNKLSLFRSICLKRSLEYPVLFSEKGTLNLQKSDLEIHVLCPDDCNQYLQRNNCKNYQFDYNNDFNDASYNNDNEYVELEDENDIHDYFNTCQYQPVDNNDEKPDYHENNDDHNNDMIKNDNIGDGDENNQSLNEEDCNNVIEIKLEVENLATNDENNDLSNTDENILNEDDSAIQNDDVEANMVKESLRLQDDQKKKKLKKSKKKGFKKILLTPEEQKAELERNRKEKKYLEAEFKCYNCAVGFLFKDTYQAHMMRHEESNGENQCETCTLRFATLALLRAHTANHIERYLCTKCGLTLKPRAQRTHCCTKNKEVQSVSCHLCGNLFKDANGLQQHLRRVHTTRQRVFACNVCGDTCNSHAAYRTHMIKHIKSTFRCSICPATYRSPYTRAQHEKTHAAVTPTVFKCACGASYSSRKSLMAHKRNTMNHQQTLLECPICNRVCPNQRSLASHIQTVHSSSKEHACTLCPARYTSRKSLLRHMATHNKREVKMAVCHLCGNSFKGNNKLNRHLREVCEKAKLEEQLSALYE